MNINKLVNSFKELTDEKLRDHLKEYRDLKTALRQLRMVSKELEEEIQLETRKGNVKILHEKHRFITSQRKKGLSLLKDLIRAN